MDVPEGELRSVNAKDVVLCIKKYLVSKYSRSSENKLFITLSTVTQAFFYLRVIKSLSVSLTAPWWYVVRFSVVCAPLISGHLCFWQRVSLLSHMVKPEENREGWLYSLRDLFSNYSIAWTWDFVQLRSFMSHVLSLLPFVRISTAQV